MKTNTFRGSSSCSQAIEDKHSNLEVGNVSTETLSILPKACIQSSPNISEGQTEYPLCISEVQHSTPINDEGLEDYVDNYLIGDDDLTEITEDFSQFQDIMDDYLAFLDRISSLQKKLNN